MNILTELYSGFPLLTYTATRRWTPEQMENAVERLRGRGILSGEELSESGLRAREDLELQTDRMQQSILDAIGEDLDTIVPVLRAWSSMVVEGDAYPPDPAKRASG
jgi:hypothetical protein